jgi:hypothetical protein
MTENSQDDVVLVDARDGDELKSPPQIRMATNAIRVCDAFKFCEELDQLFPGIKHSPRTDTFREGQAALFFSVVLTDEKTNATLPRFLWFEAADAEPVQTVWSDENETDPESEFPVLQRSAIPAPVAGKRKPTQAAWKVTIHYAWDARGADDAKEQWKRKHTEIVRKALAAAKLALVPPPRKKKTKSEEADGAGNVVPEFDGEGDPYVAEDDVQSDEEDEVVAPPPAKRTKKKEKA